MKKKVIALMLGVMMTLTVIGCGGKDNGSKADGTEVVEGTEAAGSVVSASSAFDLKAEDYVKLCDYDAIEVTITGDYEVAEGDATDYFAQIFAENGPFYTEDTSKTVVGEGDIVNVDYVGKLHGTAFDGGTAEGQLIDVYNNKSADGISGFIDGFTEGLKGASVGDVIDWDITFPEDYGNADLAGKDVVFTFTVNSIQKEMTVEDVDDAFAKEQFQVDTVEAMYDQINSYLTSAAEYGKQNDTFTAIRDYLLNNCTVEVPEDYLNARVSDYRRQFIQNNCNGDESQLETYLTTYYGKTVEDAEAEWKEGIRENVSLEFILEAVAAKEKIKLDEDGFKVYIQDMITNNGYESEDTVYTMYGYGDPAYGEKYLRQLYVDELALKKIQDSAVITIEPASGEGAESVDATEAAETSTEAE